MEIASKDLGINEITGLERKISIDNKIIIDLKNKTVIVEGNIYTYSPTGVIIDQERFTYERDNVPAIQGKNEILDDNGNIISPAILEVAANNRFDVYANSPIGLGISEMIQQTLNTL